MRRYIYAMIAIIIWGTSAVATKLLVNDIDSMFMICGCALIATICILCQLTITKKTKVLLTYGKKDYLKMAFNGAIGILGTNFFFCSGVARLTAQEASVLNYMWPVWIVIFSAIILKERMSLCSVLSILISLVGISFVVFKGDFSTVNFSDPVGIIMILSGSICYGLYSVLTKNNTYDRSVCTMVSYALAFVVALIYILFAGKIEALSLSQVLGMLFIGVFNFSLAYVLWAKALDGEMSAKIASLAFISPFISLILSVIMLGEVFEVGSFIGLALIIVGIFVQNIKVKSKNKSIEASDSSESNSLDSAD